MEKLLFAICLLAAVFTVPADPGPERSELEIAFHAGDALRVDLRMESDGPVVWKILLRTPILSLTYSDRGRFVGWRPRHA
jgi:hypothetical protein